MKNHVLSTKKILSLPLVAVMLFFSLGAPKAEAFLAVPSWDGLSIIETIVQQAADNSMELLQEAARVTADQAVYAAGQALLNQMTDNIVTWVQGGFNGSPSFSVNTEKLFFDIADMTAGKFASEIRGLATCNFTPTFNNDLANMVDLSTRRNAQAKFAAQARCPFPQSINTSDFYSDFKNGGWGGFESTLADSGNPLGLRLLTGRELTTRQEEKKDTQKQELGWAGGFLSVPNPNDCTYPEGMGGEGSWTEGLSQGQLQQSFCTKATPGKVVGDQLNKALGVDMDKLGLVDNINKIIGAVVNQFTSEARKSLF